MNFFLGGSDIIEICIEYEWVWVFGVGCDDYIVEIWYVLGYYVYIEDNLYDL